ncbi:MAG: RagB/SusD family nutrient uptake outer membrane protein, partial [Tannerellaceae bacterium]
MKSIITFSKIGMVALAASALVMSCSDSFLDRPPLGTLDEQTYLSTEDAGYKLLVKCYTHITDHWNYQDAKFIFGDQLADDCSKGGSDAGDRARITEVTQGRPLATNGMLTDYWTFRYKDAISPCNIFLSKVTPETQLIQTGGAIVAKEVKERWIAEAHFLRAFYYYDLATVFANIPIIKEPLEAVDKATITKADKEEVKKFILEDLAFAIDEPNLPGAAN